MRDIFGDDDEDEDHIDDHNSNNQQGENDDKDFEETTLNTEAAQDGDAAEDEEEEDIQLPSFKKKRADGDSSAPEPTKKKLTKKPRPAGGVTGEGDKDLPLDPKQAALEKFAADFEMAVKSGKTSTRRRKKDEEDVDTKLDENAARFVAKMREAAFADIDSKLKNTSALAKVRMLESVKRQLNKSHVHNIFMDNGILEAMKLWLEPLQDASLPSLDIIQEFLDILDVLPITTDHLVSSGVGRVVYFYTKVDDSRVTPSIKRKAHTLVDKWSRPIIKLSQDYRDKTISYADGDFTSGSSKRRRPDVSSSSRIPEEPDNPKRMGVRVPQIDRGSYAIMPESSLTFDKSRNAKSDRYKKLKSHMARIKQVGRS
ncbi:Transcription factor iws1 [Haplosporangium sp. Z 767]|nr:Transcription factor iws1 [Haplosporangium sp. Z 11]KAF9181694.1 Transcription factor iws1 [Haplosporangium sp. Z 767]